MQGDIEHVLSQLTTAIKESNLQICHELTAKFQTSFAIQMQQPELEAEQINQLSLHLDTFQNLVQVLQEEKKQVASEITKLKRNSAKISQYNQYK